MQPGCPAVASHGGVLFKWIAQTISGRQDRGRRLWFKKDSVTGDDPAYTALSLKLSQEQARSQGESMLKIDAVLAHTRRCARLRPAREGPVKVPKGQRRFGPVAAGGGGAPEQEG